MTGKRWSRRAPNCRQQVPDGSLGHPEVGSNVPLRRAWATRDIGLRKGAELRVLADGLEYRLPPGFFVRCKGERYHLGEFEGRLSRAWVGVNTGVIFGSSGCPLVKRDHYLL